MIEPLSRPKLARAVRLRYDHVRGVWMLLSPERGFVLNQSGLDIVSNLGLPVTDIAANVGAPSVAAVVEFLDELCRKRLVET